MTPETDWFTLFVITFSGTFVVMYGAFFVLFEIAVGHRRKSIDRFNKENPNKPRILY